MPIPDGLASEIAAPVLCGGITFDFILSTVSADLPWMEYLGALKSRGKLCITGVPGSDLHFNAFPVILGQKTICGSPIGSPADISRMLARPVESGVKTQIEQFPLAQVNEALKRVKNNEARYRVVLVK